MKEYIKPTLTICILNSLDIILSSSHIIKSISDTDYYEEISWSDVANNIFN